VGTGSVGMRHIRNLLALGVRVHAYRHRPPGGDQQPLPAGVLQVSDIALAMVSCDGVVVANRTDQHVDTALLACEAGKPVFVEKPLSLSLAGVDALAQRVADRQLVVEAGFTLRRHPNLIWMQQQLTAGALGSIHYFRAAVGQHLADWRPGTDYRAGYSARPEWGGGVIFDLIHELDLVAWLGGQVTEATAMTRRVDSLGIQTEAIAQIGLRLASGALAQVHLDYVRPRYERMLEVVGERGFMVWDYTHGSVWLGIAGKPAEVVHRVPATFERNTMFYEHMARFLDRIDDRDNVCTSPVSPLDDAVAALRLALACHRSAQDRRVVSLAEIDNQYQVTGNQQ
jgi:predicted dehydrogenase